MGCDLSWLWYSPQVPFKISPIRRTSSFVAKPLEEISSRTICRTSSLVARPASCKAVAGSDEEILSAYPPRTFYTGRDPKRLKCPDLRLYICGAFILSKREFGTYNSSIANRHSKFTIRQSQSGMKENVV